MLTVLSLMGETHTPAIGSGSPLKGGVDHG